MAILYREMSVAMLSGITVSFCFVSFLGIHSVLAFHPSSSPRSRYRLEIARP